MASSFIPDPLESSRTEYLVAVLVGLWTHVRHGIQRQDLWSSSASTPGPGDLNPASPNNEPPTTVNNTPVSPSPSRANSPLTAETREHTNLDIAKLLRHAANLPIKTPTTQGFIYIFHATHNNIPLVKIGHTKNAVDTRLRAMQWSCPSLHIQAAAALPSSSSTTTSSSPNNHPNNHPNSSPDNNNPNHPNNNCHHAIPTHYHHHVEKLAHTELRSALYKFICPDCRHEHREFFTVDFETARRVVSRWARFCGARVAPWEGINIGAVGVGAGGGEGGGPAVLTAPWRARLEDYDGLVALPVAGEGSIEKGMALWDGFVDAGVGAWVWHDARRAAGVLWRCLSWVVAVGLAVLAAVWCRSASWAAPAWVMLGFLVVVLVLTVLALPTGPTYGWPALCKGLLWLAVVVMLMGFVGVCLHRGWELTAWVLTWMLVVAFMCMILVLMGFRCVAAEYLRRRA